MRKKYVQSSKTKQDVIQFTSGSGLFLHDWGSHQSSCRWRSIVNSSQHAPQSTTHLQQETVYTLFRYCQIKWNTMLQCCCKRLQIVFADQPVDFDSSAWLKMWLLRGHTHTHKMHFLAVKLTWGYWIGAAWHTCTHLIAAPDTGPSHQHASPSISISDSSSDMYQVSLNKNIAPILQITKLRADSKPPLTDGHLALANQ